MMPKETAELACVPNTVFASRNAIPAAAVTAFRRVMLSMNPRFPIIRPKYTAAAEERKRANATRTAPYVSGAGGPDRPCPHVNGTI